MAEDKTRPLLLIWIVDSSGSMAAGGRIQALNNAMRDAIPHLQELQRRHPAVELSLRVLTFSDGARWQAGKAVAVDAFRWTDITAGGETDLGQALSLVAGELSGSAVVSDQALPPVLVLLTDGYPTDDFEAGLGELLDQPWGAKARRLAVAIGDDVDEQVLQMFIGDPRVQPLRPDNPEALRYAVEETIIQLVSE